MTAEELLAELAPTHRRTSCSDEQSNGNEYFNEGGYPRCVRCALLYRLKNGHWPHKATFRIEELRVIHGGERAERITHFNPLLD